MKIVKLDNRHSAFKEGFSHALRFDSWDTKVSKVEQKLHDIYGNTNWPRRNASTWFAQFGSRGKLKYKPYWVYFRDEASITMLFLAIPDIWVLSNED